MSEHANASGLIPKVERYSALALQTACDAVNQDKNPDSAHERMASTITRVTGQIAASIAFLTGFNGYPVKLVVLPEYWLTGFPMRESREEWRAKAAIDIDGSFSDLIAGLARKFVVYLCSNHYENDPNFPDLYFQSNVIYDPNGEPVLRYRRMISLYTPSPFDVWDDYLECYGEAAIFPVVETEIGALGTIASEEILYPEIARMHVMAGAELLLHPTSEVASPAMTPKDIAKRARAMENLAYVVSANTGGMHGTSVPTASVDAMSKIVDWKGQVVSEAGYGETMNANAIIDLDGLRSARQQTGMSNFLSRLPTAAFASRYQQHLAPPNRTPDGKMITKEEAGAQQRAVIARLSESGMLKR